MGIFRATFYTREGHRACCKQWSYPLTPYLDFTTMQLLLLRTAHYSGVPKRRAQTM